MEGQNRPGGKKTMKCAVCQKDKSGPFCLCGFCDDCIRTHGHDKCAEIARDKQLNRSPNNSKGQ